MRPLETVVFVHAIAWCGSLLTQAGRNRPWLKVLVAASGAALAGQTLAEGYRPVLLPMYTLVLLGVTWGAWAVKEVADTAPHGHRRTLGAAGLLLALGLAWGLAG